MSEKITLKFSDRRPLCVFEEDWPIIARAVDYNGDGPHTIYAYKLRVRSDGDRYAVYGGLQPHDKSEQEAWHRYAGRLLSGNSALIDTIRWVCDQIGAPQALATVVITDLPADDETGGEP